MSDLATLHANMIAAQAEREAWINVQGEGARDWTPMDAREEAAVMAYTTALFASEWTDEVIAERKAAWNAWVVATGKPTWAQIVEREKAQGWKLCDLKAAIALAKRAH